MPTMQDPSHGYEARSNEPIATRSGSRVGVATVHQWRIDSGLRFPDIPVECASAVHSEGGNDYYFARKPVSR